MLKWTSQHAGGSYARKADPAGADFGRGLRRRRPRGPLDQPVSVASLAAHEVEFGAGGAMGLAVRDFFANGGTRAYIVRVVNETGDPIADAQLIGPGFQTSHKGPYALDKASSFNLLCIPPLSPKPA